MSGGFEIDPVLAERMHSVLGEAADRVVLTAPASAVAAESTTVSDDLESWVDWAVTCCGAQAGAVRDTGVDAARAAGTFVEADRVLALGVSPSGMRAR